jgi:L-seryl-tRNA(Ser) seleniumtransferase
MKVNKEELLGMLVALQSFVLRDHAADRREYDKRAEVIRAAVAAVPGAKAEVFVPEVANHVPHIRVSWEGADEAAAGAAVKAMKDGEPSIGIRNEGKDLVLGVWMMRPGEDKIVARRLRQVLERKA